MRIPGAASDVLALTPAAPRPSAPRPARGRGTQDAGEPWRVDQIGAVLRGRINISLPLGVCILLLLQLALPARAGAPLDAISPASGVDPRLHEWIVDPFVRRTLGGSDFDELESQLRRIDGYLGVHPGTSGTYVAYWEGRAPVHAPRRSPDGHDVVHVGNTRAEPLIDRARTTTDAISLQDLERRLAAEAPDAPTAGPVQGIGPGGAIRMTKADETGRIATYICSASYLFHDPAKDLYYHCSSSRSS